MTIAKIHGSEYPIRKIFSNDFNFKVPLYQRPYSWTTEQAGELLADLVSLVGLGSSTSIDELSPYFLGSIVLIKEESEPEAEVVDGQQRLTTLTIKPPLALPTKTRESAPRPGSLQKRFCNWWLDRCARNTARDFMVSGRSCPERQGYSVPDSRWHRRHGIVEAIRFNGIKP
jgi:hypothetical protein